MIDSLWLKGSAFNSNDDVSVCIACGSSSATIETPPVHSLRLLNSTNSSSKSAILSPRRLYDGFSADGGDGPVVRMVELSVGRRRSCVWFCFSSSFDDVSRSMIDEWRVTNPRGDGSDVVILTTAGSTLARIAYTPLAKQQSPMKKHSRTRSCQRISSLKRTVETDWTRLMKKSLHYYPWKWFERGKNVYALRCFDAKRTKIHFPGLFNVVNTPTIHQFPATTV